MDCPTIGYHKIRGLGAPLRMMCFYKEQKFNNVAYGADMKETWFAGKKEELKKDNTAINLPYIVHKGEVITQSNTCLLYLGQNLGVDKSESFIHNHMILDQAYDLRNDLMKIVYPFGPVKSKEEFPAAAKDHLDGAKGHCAKLEGLFKGDGPFFNGATPQSGDFSTWEMLDQHVSICKSVGVDNILDGFPKLAGMHAAMIALPTLAKYFEHDCYKTYFQNNGLFTFYTGQPDGADYGPMVDEVCL